MMFMMMQEKNTFCECLLLLFTSKA